MQMKLIINLIYNRFLGAKGPKPHSFSLRVISAPGNLPQRKLFSRFAEGRTPRRGATKNDGECEGFAPHDFALPKSPQ